MNFKCIQIMMLTITVAIMLSAVPSSAQTVSVQNDYIGFIMGEHNWYWEDDQPGMILEDNGIEGRFCIWTTGGDPSTTEDDNKVLIYSPYSCYPGDKWGCWQIMIDTIIPAEDETDDDSGDGSGDDTGDTPAFRSQAYKTESSGGYYSPAAVGDELYRWWGTFPNGVTSGIWGDDTDGIWWEEPTANAQAGTITGMWEPLPIAVETDDETDDDGSTTPQTTGMSTSAISTKQLDDLTPMTIGCKLEAKLMRDTVRFKWTITNYDIYTHMVGLRLCMDVMAEPSNAGTRDGSNVPSIPNGPIINSPTVLSGNDIPARLEIFNSQTDPVVGIRHTFSGSDATVPDKVGIDEWAYGVADPNWTYGMEFVGDLNFDILYAAWLYEPLAADFIDELGTGAFWKPRPLGPGQTMNVIHYVGLASASTDYVNPSSDHIWYVSAVQGPRTLQHLTSENQAVPSPASFDISAYLYNVSDVEGLEDLQDAQCTLILPEGLSLDSSENGHYSKLLGTIPTGTEESATWKVVTDDPPPGILKYYVSFSASPAGGSVVEREIYIPATERQSLSSGWQMVSVPYTINSFDPVTALGLSGNVLGFWRYDASQPLTDRYQQVDRVVPGEAYWLKLAAAQTTSISADHAPVPWVETDGYDYELKNGWNMIGNPYVYSIPLGQTRFYLLETGEVLSYTDAVAQGWIKGILYSWNANAGQYDRLINPRGMLTPWNGYWMKALKPGITMILSPVQQIGASLEETDEGEGDNPPPPPVP